LNALHSSQFQWVGGEKTRIIASFIITAYAESIFSKLIFEGIAMANDHAPTDCFTGLDAKLNRVGGRLNAAVRPNAGVLRAMFASVPETNKPVAKAAAPRNQASQQVKPKTSSLVPSL
jgi:hypothetical protein